MLDVKAQEQDVVQRFVNFVLQAVFVAGRVAAAQQAQRLHFLVVIL